MSSAKCVLNRSRRPSRVDVAGGGAHPRLRHAVLAERRAARDGDVAERAVLVVAVLNGRRRVRRDVQIDPAVLVEVGRHHRHRKPVAHARDAGRLGHIGEASIAQVAIQQVGVGRQTLGAAVDRDALPQTVHALARLGGRREIEGQVVRHEEIEVAVAVVVEKRAAGTPPRPGHRQAGGGAAIVEPAVAAIAVQPVGAEGRDVDVDGAVVVVVAGADRRGPRRPPESRALRDVGERAVAAIAIHPRRRFAAGQAPDRRDARRRPVASRRARWHPPSRRDPDRSRRRRRRWSR